MNVMKASNAKKGPHKAMNAYSEYTDKELDGQIAAMTMDYLNMKNFEGIQLFNLYRIEMFVFVMHFSNLCFCYLLPFEERYTCVIFVRLLPPDLT